MLRTAAIYLYLGLLAWHFNGCLAEPDYGARSVCLLDDPPNQCGQFCLTALMPMLNHIAFHQDEWSACGAAKVNDTQGKLDKLQSHLEALQTGQELISKVGSSLESKVGSLGKIIPEDFRAGWRGWKVRTPLKWKSCKQLRLHWSLPSKKSRGTSLRPAPG